MENIIRGEHYDKSLGFIKNNFNIKIQLDSEPMERKLGMEAP